ncbi:hypothetical protein F2Q69_00052676 [Brassica cretica]|uniref:Uncharacterized protein n=1 Tax=Brassica cretica TaxID=69181 RepID=A0A8S9N7N5_BRACR|nr:hypothetical protein F2Q69_00052676 [Brassica cretica]
MAATARSEDFGASEQAVTARPQATTAILITAATLLMAATVDCVEEKSDLEPRDVSSGLVKVERFHGGDLGSSLTNDRDSGINREYRGLTTRLGQGRGNWAGSLEIGRR